jgi:sugar lactone lactonase YvrE
MTTKVIGAELFLDAQAEHGEGPAWDASVGRLLWVDQVGRQLHATAPDGSELMVRYPQDVCVVVPRASGGRCLAVGDSVWLENHDGRLDQLITPDPGQATGFVARMNDGKCDPQGRFWVGSMAPDVRSGAGVLYRLDSDREAHRVLVDLTIPNGTAWAPGGDRMFFIDSPTQRVDVFRMDPVTGEIDDRRCLLDIPANLGVPDGMTIDDDGALWVALWGGGAVHRYTQDGRLDTVVRLPCAFITSCTFGDSDGGVLYITTSRQMLPEEDEGDRRLAGGVFAVRPGVTGPAAIPFAG